MWAFLWRYVIVPLLVALLTWSAAGRQHAAETDKHKRRIETLEALVQNLRDRLHRRDEEDRRPFPFHPWLRPDPAADPDRLPPQAVGERPQLEVHDGL